MTPLTLERLGTYEGGGVASHESLQGFAAARRFAEGQRARQIDMAAKLMADVMTGAEDPFLLKEAMYPQHEYAVLHLMESYPGIFGNIPSDRIGLRETMSLSDYTALTVDVLDRMYYGFYNSYPIPNKSLVKMRAGGLRDFRTVKRFMEDGLVTPLALVQNGSAIPERSLTPETVKSYAPALYAARTSVNWRAMVNDDLGIFADLAQRLAIAGNRGIHKFITGLYIDANGPHASLYTSGFTNIINIANGAASNNPPLSIQGIQDAFVVLGKMKDAGGDPILVNGKLTLWYGPALTAVAQNLMHMLTAQLSVNGGTANAQGFPTQFIEVNNWAIQNMATVMDPYIPIVCTVATTQDTTWGITADPNIQNRPSTEMGFLQGFDTPQLFQKVPNTQRLGGGVDPTLGDFRTMDQELKVVTVFGGTQIDGRSTVASTGRGV